jgi:hypothetical protein
MAVLPLRAGLEWVGFVIVAYTLFAKSVLVLIPEKTEFVGVAGLRTCFWKEWPFAIRFAILFASALSSLTSRCNWTLAKGVTSPPGGERNVALGFII